MNLMLLILSLISATSNSIFSKNEVWPFTKTVDFGISFNSFLSQLSIPYSVDSNSCKKKFVTVNDGVDIYGTPVTVIYSFYNDTLTSNKTKIFGLYQVEVIYSNNTDLTSDDNVVEFHVIDYANLFGVKYSQKKGNLVSNYNVMNDHANPSGGIFSVDNVWFVIAENGNIVVLNFPTKERIRMGQKSRTIYKKKYSIDWKCE